MNIKNLFAILCSSGIEEYANWESSVLYVSFSLVHRVGKSIANGD